MGHFSDRWNERRRRARVVNDLLAESEPPSRLDLIDEVRWLRFKSVGDGNAYAETGAVDMVRFCEGRVSALTDVLDLIDPERHPDRDPDV